MRATIEPRDKVFALMLGKHELGVSKTDFDARFHMHAINDALDVAYLEGQKYLERMVEAQRMELEFQKAIMQVKAEQAQDYLAQERQVQTSGPQCKKCGAFTTQARVDSHGMCMKCETESQSS